MTMPSSGPGTFDAITNARAAPNRGSPIVVVHTPWELLVVVLGVVGSLRSVAGDLGATGCVKLMCQVAATMCERWPKAAQIIHHRKHSR